ncbi:DUF5677 domain-containing protein [Pseudoalteromonas piscicida]|uniref:DUF5677 domain-containing protein n=1 Tax=Pseudoalteromonas piscicida TaxID=43662 RepID=UPI0032BFB5A8
MMKYHEQFTEAIEDLHRKSPDKADLALSEEKLKSWISDVSKVILTSLSSQSKEMLEERHKHFCSFNKTNENKWKKAFNKLETHIVICTEAGESVNNDYRADAVEKGDIKFDLLVRHHARACHIANEILCLLKNGFADAAHARWRALHEVNITSMFIAKHGRECAERFLSHEIIDSYLAMKEHKKYEDRLNEKAPDETVIAAHRKEYDVAIKKFGKGFETHYGWAAYLFDRPPKTVGFATIEKDVGLDHMRPYYKWASQNIHAGSKGTRSRLALSECHSDTLIVGPSDSGMADPAHATAISLMQSTITLLNTRPTIDHAILIDIVITSADEVGDIFFHLMNKHSKTNKK